MVLADRPTRAAGAEGPQRAGPIGYRVKLSTTAGKFLWHAVAGSLGLSSPRRRSRWHQTTPVSRPFQMAVLALSATLLRRDIDQLVRMGALRGFPSGT